METEVFIISTSLFTGGAERQAIWLSNSLSKTGYTVNLLVLKKGDELSHLVNKKVNISRFKIYSSDSKLIFKYLRLARLAFLTILKINKMLKKSDKKNIVVISYMFHSYVFGFITKILNPKIKLIYSVRSDRLGRRTSKKSKTRHLIFKLISKNTYAILFNSTKGMNSFKKELNKKSNLQFIPNGINSIDKCDDDKTSQIIKEFLGDSSLNYVVSARVDPLNNYFNLIKALSILNQNGCDFKCVIFGRGVESAKIQLQIKDLNLSDKILMMGNVKNASSYYHFFNLLIHPAFHAGFSNSVTEAIQIGLNVVIGKVGDTTNIFNKSNLVFELFTEDAIYKSINNFNNLEPQEKEMLIIESQNKLYSLLNNDKTIKKWVDIIE
ncbi:glycosyltransferase [Acidimicrobiaceae bacterium]|nr:glycosyltransferase [Acidimicrobiaceae bacterium]